MDRAAHEDCHRCPGLRACADRPRPRAAQPRRQRRRNTDGITPIRAALPCCRRRRRCAYGCRCGRAGPQASARADRASYTSGNPQRTPPSECGRISGVLRAVGRSLPAIHTQNGLWKRAGRIRRALRLSLPALRSAIRTACQRRGYTAHWRKRQATRLPYTAALALAWFTPESAEKSAGRAARPAQGVVPDLVGGRRAIDAFGGGHRMAACGQVAKAVRTRRRFAARLGLLRTLGIASWLDLHAGQRVGDVRSLSGQLSVGARYARPVSRRQSGCGRICRRRAKCRKRCLPRTRGVIKTCTATQETVALPETVAQSTCVGMARRRHGGAETQACHVPSRGRRVQGRHSAPVGCVSFRRALRRWWRSLATPSRCCRHLPTPRRPTNRRAVPFDDGRAAGE